jgi:hypothetical protein
MGRGQCDEITCCRGILANTIHHMPFFRDRQLPPLSKGNLLRSIEGLPTIPSAQRSSWIIFTPSF